MSTRSNSAFRGDSPAGEPEGSTDKSADGEFHPSTLKLEQPQKTYNMMRQMKKLRFRKQLTFFFSTASQKLDFSDSSQHLIFLTLIHVVFRPLPVLEALRTVYKVFWCQGVKVRHNYKTSGTHSHNFLLC